MAPAAPGRLPTAEEMQELPTALTVEAVQRAAPGAIRRVVLDAQVRATAFMALLGNDTLAQKLYWHYLNGSGTDIWFTRDEARRLRSLAEAERDVETRFAETTLSGRTKDGRVAAFLRAIPDGQEHLLPMLENGVPIAGTRLDVFDFNDGSRLGLTAASDALRDPGGYLAVGQTSARGGLTRGSVRRNDNTILLEGTVRFGLDDPFDFRQGQPGGWESVMLERFAGARSFAMRAQWDRKLTATIEVGSKGAGQPTFKLREAVWRDVD